MVCAGWNDSSSSVFKSGGGQAGSSCRSRVWSARCTRVCAACVCMVFLANNPTYGDLGCALAGAAAKSFVAAACGMKAHSHVHVAACTHASKTYMQERNQRVSCACSWQRQRWAMLISGRELAEGSLQLRREGDERIDGRTDGCTCCGVYRSLLVSLCVCSVCFRMGCRESN